MPKFITSADASYAISAQGVFSSPQTLQQWSADRLFSTDAVTIVEEMMGVDGILSFGWVPCIFPQTLMLMANSPSGFIFDQIFQTGRTKQQPIVLSATVTLPAIGQQYNFRNGTLKTYTPVPEAAKVLQPRSFGLIWGDFSASPINSGLSLSLTIG